MTTEAAAKKDIQKLQRAIIDGLEDVKAQDIQVFDTEHLTALFERVIVASGTSNRQTKALAASVRDAVREAGFGKPRTEGEENGEWIIVDCGAAVAHIMQPAIRQYYHLEEIWGDKPVRSKLGASKPATAAKAVAEEKAPVAAKMPSLRRTSAAKTAVRAAEQVAREEKAKAKPASRRAPAKKTTTRTPVKVVGKPAAKKVAAKPAAAKPVTAKPPATAKPAAKKVAAKKVARKTAPKKP